MARPTTEPLAVRLLLIAVALAFLALFLVMPLVVVFQQALEKGLSAYVAAIREPDALSALRLTLLTAAIAVPANLLFGLAASWAIARFDFPGRSFLLTLVDLPFAISPVISGVVFISGNMPMKTEIAPLVIMTKLEQYDYAGATAIAVTLLVASFLLLGAINLLQAWSARRGAVE